LEPSRLGRHYSRLRIRRETMQAGIHQMFRESAEVKLRFAEEYAPRIEAVARRMADVLRRGGKLLFFGNGGSAADAQHLAAEFVNRFLRDRGPLAAVALTTDTSALTSIGNDLGFDQVFARQVEALARPGDLVVAISTSGNSPNVLRGVEAARRLGCATVGLTGGSGGLLATAVDEVFVVPSTETPRIQETHITLGHALCAVVDEILLSVGDPAAGMRDS
jgi:D-sedoheptulose 7-phosphate isomerase